MQSIYLVPCNIYTSFVQQYISLYIIALCIKGDGKKFVILCFGKLYGMARQGDLF